MKKVISILILPLFLLSCRTDAKTEKETIPAINDTLVAVTNSVEKPAEIIAPEGYTEIGRATGDLNKDDIDETVIVYNNGIDSEWGEERELFIYKKEANQWVLWHKSKGPVMAAEEGGVWGDPFENIAIEKQCIVVSHFGGSNWKWSYTHRYRFQNNDWFLIGATTSDGTPGVFWDTYDFNLSTGKLNVVKEHSVDRPGLESRLNTEKDLVYQLDSLPKMDNYVVGGINIKLPQDTVEFSI